MSAARIWDTLQDVGIELDGRSNEVLVRWRLFVLDGPIQVEVRARLHLFPNVPAHAFTVVKRPRHRQYHADDSGVIIDIFEKFFDVTRTTCERMIK